MATYVMSDIHGLQPRFSAMLERIHFQDEDTLYILGDVIDRGDDGIALLQQILHHPRMKLLMGNHEHMMWEYYEAADQLANGRFSVHALECIQRWNRNHNEATKRDFAALGKGEQRALLDHLRELPLAYTDVQVKQRRFYLVHANWTSQLDQPVLYLNDFIQKNLDPIPVLWDRIDENAPLPPKRTLIFGHTITAFYQPQQPYQIWSANKALSEARMIAIDCGCAAQLPQSRLACLCLDDMEVFYV